MSGRRLWLGLFFSVPILLVGALLADAPASQQSAEDALTRARVEGKYRLLLRQVRAPEDQKEHGAFKDLGYQTRGEVRGFWVYVAPSWYVWRDETSAIRPRRNWGPEQLVGPPDTWPRAGDQVTAWASLTEDGDDEWLLLEYAELVQPSAVLIYETFNPGAVRRVLVYRPDGEEVEVWKGNDPTPVGSEKGVSVIPFRIPFRTNRIKIELRSREVGGWNEIDTVGLRAGGKVHWPVAAEASSSYATLIQPPPAPAIPVDDRKLDVLEKDVSEIKERLKKLEERIRKRKQMEQDRRR